RAVLVAPRDDALRQRWTDTRQTCDLAHVCSIQVYPLSGQQWSRKLRRAASCFAKGVRALRGGRLQLHVAGRSSGRWSEEEANTGACQRQAREDQGGAFIVHYGAWCVVRGAWDYRGWCMVRGAWGVDKPCVVRGAWCRSEEH